jgi:hypothetical protein
VSTRTAFHHDFGFLNGPLLVEADDGVGGTASWSCPAARTARSTRATRPMARRCGRAPWHRRVTPAFAGFGLFNGAVGFVSNRFVVALNDFVPALASPPEHLMAFSPVDGSSVWQDEIGASWGSIGAGGGLVVVGTLASDVVYVYDATTGARLATLTMPDTVTSGASIVDGTIYVGYGIAGQAGGVRAFGLPEPSRGRRSRPGRVVAPRPGHWQAAWPHGSGHRLDLHGRRWQCRRPVMAGGRSHDVRHLPTGRDPIREGRVTLERGVAIVVGQGVAVCVSQHCGAEC